MQIGRPHPSGPALQENFVTKQAGSPVFRTLFLSLLQSVILTGKDPDAGKDWRQEEKGMTEEEMVGWHHPLYGHEFEQALGVGDGQGGLACCSPRGCKELDTTERLNWTESVAVSPPSLLFMAFSWRVAVSPVFSFGLAWDFLRISLRLCIFGKNSAEAMLHPHGVLSGPTRCPHLISGDGLTLVTWSRLCLLGFSAVKL